MNITIVGAGNIGCTLAVAFKKAGHKVVFGVKDPAITFKGKDIADEHGFPYFKTTEAVAKSDIIILSTPAQFAIDVAKSLGDVSGKVIIDAMNAVFMKEWGVTNTADAILNNCNCTDVVKCFNTTGFENIANPLYDGDGIDMFVAGDSEKGKQAATQLAKDIGFAICYDFGGNDKFLAIEQLAFAWINLAIIQKHGRGIAFKILKR